MRIIAGSARGRTLATPKDSRVRPTTDRVRESLFALLGSFDESVVWDVFSGTGALGLEALSRGADYVYLSDSSRASIQIIEENVRRVDGGDRVRVLAMSYERALERLEHDPDVIFLDPPYESGLLESALTLIAKSQVIGKGALMVCEQGASEVPIRHPAFELDDERVYGGTRITLLIKGETEIPNTL